MANSGNFDVIDQTQTGLLSGGNAAQQVVTTDASAKPNGSSAVWQNGNIVAGGGSGSGSTHTEILTDSNGPITSNGDYIYVTGVPD